MWGFVVLFSAAMVVAGPCITFLISKRWLLPWVAFVALFYTVLVVPPEFVSRFLTERTDCSGGGCFGHGLLLIVFAGVGIFFNLAMMIVRGFRELFPNEGYGR